MGFDCPSRESDPRLLVEILVIFPPAALALANGFVILDEYKFIADLLADVTVPTEGIISRVLQKDEHVNITLFGFSPGQELSTHSAPTPAVQIGRAHV